MKLFWYFFSYVGGIFTVCLHWTDTTVFHHITKRFLFFEAHNSRNSTFFPRSLKRRFATLNLLFCNGLFGLCLLFLGSVLQWACSGFSKIATSIFLIAPKKNIFDPITRISQVFWIDWTLMTPFQDTAVGVN